MSERNYEEFTKQDLIDWIELCNDYFDKENIPDNEMGALFSVYGRLTKYAGKKSAELADLRAENERLKSENRFIDGIVMGDGSHDKVMLVKDAAIFLRCMKLLGLDISGADPEAIVDAIENLKLTGDA